MTSNNSLELYQRATEYFDGYTRGSRISKDDIIIRREYLTLVGGNLTEAAIFSRIMHWQPYLKEQNRDALAKNHNEWMQECGVTASAARKALKRLEEKKLITTELGKFNGTNTVMIKVNVIAFYQSMTGEHLLQKDMSSVTKGQMEVLHKDRSIYKDNLQGKQQETESPDTAKAAAGGTPEKQAEKPKATAKKKAAPVKEEKPWFDDYLIEDDVAGRAESLRNMKIDPPPTPRPKTRYKALPSYQHLEHVVKHMGEYKKSDGIILGQTLRWLWLEATGRSGQPATYEDAISFWLWIHRQGINIKDPKKIKGRWWADWKKANPTVQSITTPQDDDGVYKMTPFGKVKVA